MAHQDAAPQGSWLLAEQLLESGDPEFIDELRRIRDADRLGAFAVTWYKDSRPASRRLLLEYLDRPLNAFRHEPLVKRLLKAACAAEDDDLMAQFMVAFDRCVRRERRKKRRFDWSTREQWTEESIRVPTGTALLRPAKSVRLDLGWGRHYLSSVQKKLHILRLFSVSTRNYLRRRAWRYFRTIGKQNPQRYLNAVTRALAKYTDNDCADGLALIDNWGLMHVLFHDTDVLEARPAGWTLRDGKSLGNLRASPAFLDAWKASAVPLVELLSTARCRAVRQWAVQMLQAHHPAALQSMPLDTLLNWMCSDDAELAELAAAALLKASAASEIPVDRWLRLTEVANPQVQDRICDLMARLLSPHSLKLKEIVQLACSGMVPVARLGLQWLRTATPQSPEDCRVLLQVCDAGTESVRSELVEVLCRAIESSPHFRLEFVLEVVDSKHADVRSTGWNWLTANEQSANDVSVWQRLMETPYDDIRLRLATLLETHAARRDGSHILQRHQLAPESVRYLWASVLLNVNRGGRQKPGVVTGLVERLKQHPSEISVLLPILAVALRSGRSTEWRAALTGIVRLVEVRPELGATVSEMFPELSIP